MNNNDLLKITKTYGSPTYVYNTATIKKQYLKLDKAFEKVSKMKIHYAVKALSNISVLKYLKTLGAGMDTVSIQEVQLCLKAGFDTKDIMYTPNGVSLEELEEVALLGVQINIDNLSILEQFGQKHPTIPVCIRINPHIMAGGNSKISVGHIDSKFGISIYQVPHIQRILEITGMQINGIHMHTGSDILDIDTFLRAADILLEVVSQFKNIVFVDFGSGFKVPYKDGDIETDIEELGEKLSKRFNAFCANYGEDLELVFEPGKYLVSEAGKFLTKVNVIKQTTSTVFAAVDSGLNHFIRPMFYDAYHHIENISNSNEKKRYYTVVGYICETDTFGSNRRIAEIQEGDILAFHNAGAYCFSMSSQYNSRYRPAEVLWHKGEAHVIREREDIEDIIGKQKSITL